MFDKLKNFLIDIFNFTSISFTLYMFIEVIFHIINKEDTLSVNSLIFVFIIFIIIAIINYLIWYSNLLKKYDYVIKRVIQYSIGLVIIYLCNELTDIYRIVFLFIYYNIFYFALCYIFMFKEKKDIEKLNKIIRKLKEDNNE